MASSINSYLTNLASDYFISYQSTERVNINRSFNTIKDRLKNHFSYKINDVVIFGSWDRDTTLPRKYDKNSDLDIMIIFNHETLNNSPETYRKWILDFANIKYPTSLSKKDFPTVRLDMTHITFDLIPTKIETILFSDQYYIPNSGNNWMTTDPFSLTKTVKQKNRNNNSIVKPVLRLIKAWNVNSGYPFDSYELEKHITNNLFWMFYGSVQSAFFAAINNLPSWNLTTTQKNKVHFAQNAVTNMKIYLDKNDVFTAKQWLHKILPY